MKGKVKLILKIALLIVAILIVIFIINKIYIMSMIDKIIDGNSKYYDTNYYKEEKFSNGRILKTCRYNEIIKQEYPENEIFIWIDCKNKDRIYYSEKRKWASIIADDEFTDYNYEKYVGLPAGFTEISRNEKDENMSSWDKMYRKICYVLTISSISSQEVNGKDCYKIKDSGNSISTYVEKERCLVVKVEDHLNNVTNDVEWKLNDITEDDVSKPDFSDYRVNLD